MKDDKPAYPFAFDEMDVNRSSFGLTRRELFAAMAMQGILSACPTTVEFPAANTAQEATRRADALIAELDQADPSHSADQWTDIEEAGERWTAACLSTSFPYEPNRISDETEPNK
jgi:hypothetical protein